MAPTDTVGAIWLFVNLTSVSSNTFIDDLIRLSQIKQKLTTSNLTLNFL